MWYTYTLQKDYPGIFKLVNFLLSLPETGGNVFFLSSLQWEPGGAIRDNTHTCVGIALKLGSHKFEFSS